MPSDLTTTKRLLESDLQRIEKQLEELKARLPAHSAKPAMMMELLDLEERRDAVLAKIQNIKNRHPE